MTEDSRISEIRAVLDAYYDAKTDSSEAVVLARVTSIIDRPTPAPRVFFPGDTLPAGVTVQNVFGETVLLVDDIDCATATVVEVAVPSREEWQAAVDRARVEREAAP